LRGARRRGNPERAASSLDCFACARNDDAIKAVRLWSALRSYGQSAANAYGSAQTASDHARVRGKPALPCPHIFVVGLKSGRDRGRVVPGFQTVKKAYHTYRVGKRGRTLALLKPGPDMIFGFLSG
jgi:hypothetical protein